MGTLRNIHSKLMSCFETLLCILDFNSSSQECRSPTLYKENELQQSLLVTHKNEWNKIAQTIWRRFPVQFFLLLQIMCSVLLSVLPVKTDYLRDADWLLKYPTNQQKGYEKLTQTTKQSTPPERALKTKLETRVRLFVLFCLTHFFVWQVVPH